jgi:hypothetical protein
MTSLIREKYNWINNIDKVKCFGKDVFSNQYVFYTDGVGILYIESGEIEYISKDFDEWLSIIKDDMDYYTGLSLSTKWSKLNGKLKYNESLSPKTPFILGGEYEIENLYNQDSISNLIFFSNLAKQIYELPNGAQIKFDVI